VWTPSTQLAAGLAADGAGSSTAGATAAPVGASATRFQCMYTCGFTESFQAVAEHEKTCSKQVPEAAVSGNASDGGGSTAPQAGLPSTAADPAVRRSAAVAADSDHVSKPAQLESGGQLGHYCFIGKSEPILRKGTLCDAHCCGCLRLCGMWLELLGVGSADCACSQGRSWTALKWRCGSRSHLARTCTLWRCTDGAGGSTVRAAAGSR
jgi:hypothetical protein